MMSTFLGSETLDRSSMPQLLPQIPTEILSGLIQGGNGTHSSADDTATDDPSSDDIMYQMLQGVCGRVSEMRVAESKAGE